MKTTFVLLSLLVSGCAQLPWLKITDEEREACKIQTCTAWTPSELSQAARKIYNEAYQAGVKSI